MNFKATASSIAASGGIRPDSHITAHPVTAIKAGSVAHTLTGQRSKTDVRRAETQQTATSRSGGRMIPSQREATILAQTAHNLGNPCAEKVRPHRPRQLFL